MSNAPSPVKSPAKHYEVHLSEGQQQNAQTVRDQLRALAVEQHSSPDRLATTVAVSKHPKGKRHQRRKSDIDRADDESTYQPLRQRTHSPPATVRPSVHSFLTNVPLFSSLPPDELTSLPVMLREYAAQDLVFERGAFPQHVYVVVSGCVEVFALKFNKQIQKRIGTVTAPNVFALESVIFEESSRFTLKSGSNGKENTVLLLVPRDAFLRVLGRNRLFAHGVGSRMTENMDIFSVFQDFCRAVFTRTATLSSEGDRLHLPTILNAYQRLENTIHPLVGDPSIDVGALYYAIRRLPQDITSAFVLNLTRSLPPYLAEEMRKVVTEGPRSTESGGPTMVRFMPTKDRRRCCWEVQKGHLVVLLREGYTDVLDFLTCYCIHQVETRKLRLRLNGMTTPRAVDVLHTALLEALKMKQEGCDEASLKELQDTTMAKLPFGEAERAGVERIFGDTTLKSLFDILMNQEEPSVVLATALSRRFDVDPYHQWAIGLRTRMLGLLGLSADEALPDNIVIDVLSSNTFGSKNILSSFVRRHEKEIFEYGEKHHPEVMNEDWPNTSDCLYWVNGKMLAASEEWRNKYKHQLSADGFVVMEETAMTGLQVDLIDVDKIKLDMIDPLLKIPKKEPVSEPSSAPPQDGAASATAKPASTAVQEAIMKIEKPLPAAKKSDAAKKQGASKPARHFFINMDYAFGAQADGIMRALILTFGHRIRSVNVMGKAGGLTGDRGDIQLPSTIIFSKSALGEDTLDEFRDVGNQDLKAERLLELLPTRQVHVGPVLTIPGTLLQNKRLLQFYVNLWGSIGLEMEGTYFARQLDESLSLGMLRRSLKRRFAYYTSDLPLRSQEASLSKGLAPAEGGPPLHAVMRAMIELMLQAC